MKFDKEKLYKYRQLTVLLVIIIILTACAPEPAAPASTPPPPTDTLSAPPTETLEPTDTAVPPTPEPDEDEVEAEATPIPPTATATLDPIPTPAESVQYRLVFNATWSAESHPVEFPSNPHFSGLIGAVHKPTIFVWEGGVLASPGMKRMAETGAKNPLTREINDFILREDACELISGNGIGKSPGTTEVTFTANQVCPAISVVTMIAPSPDWFVGVSALNLLQDGAWVEELVVELLPWDAGTDSGASYASSNAATNPPDVISLLEAPSLQVNGDLSPLGTFTLTRVAD